MSYTVSFTNSDKSPIVIQDENIDTSTDLALFGRKTLQYGADMNQNLLSLLEKFACPEDPKNPGNPNLSLSGGKLQTPVQGQFWYNSTEKNIYFYSNGAWTPLLTSGGFATNWGIITNGQQIPQPVGVDGYVYPYNQCVWIVGPFQINGQILDYSIQTSSTAVVTAEFNSGNPLVVNYLIVGIRGNVNKGTLSPVVTPTMTPTISVTPSVTPLSVNPSSGLISFWEFEEAASSTTFSDAIGTNNFTLEGSTDIQSLPDPPPYNATHGKVNHAIQAGTTTYFQAVPTAGMATGNGAQYTFGGWFRLNSTFIGYSNIFQRGLFGTAGQRSFTLTYTLSTDGLTLFKSSDGTAYEFLVAQNLGIHDYNWHFIVAWVDGVNLTLNIQVDNGTVHSTTIMNSPTFNVGSLMLGNSTGIPLQTAVDQLFYYNRVLNSSERSILWNNGNGVTAASVAGLVTPTPSPTVTPSPTPAVTPTIYALTVTVNTYLAAGTCSGAGCTAVTNSIFGTISGGVAPYTSSWVYVAGTTATVNSPASYQSSFQRSGTSQTLTGFYRLEVQDAAGTIVYSPLIEVQTVHS